MVFIVFGVWTSEKQLWKDKQKSVFDLILSRSLSALWQSLITILNYVYFHKKLAIQLVMGLVCLFCFAPSAYPNELQIQITTRQQSSPQRSRVKVVNLVKLIKKESEQPVVSLKVTKQLFVI